MIYVVMLALIAYIGLAAWRGTWYGTWCASGRKIDGRKFPGGPAYDPYSLRRDR